MRVLAIRLCFIAYIALALVCQSAERIASAKLKNGELPDAKRTNWPPKLGVKTPGVQVPMTELKPEAEIALTESVDGLVIADKVYVVHKAKDELVPIDGKTNKTGDAIAGFHQPCATLLSAFGSIWAPNCKDQTISRFDPKTGKIMATLSLNILELRHSLAASSDSVWALTDERTTLARIDPEENRIVAEIRLPAGCNSILFAENALWVTCPAEEKVLRIDPNTSLVTNRIEVTGQPAALSFGEKSVWVLGKAESKIVRIDPKTNKITATIELKVPGVGGTVASSDGFAWVSMPGFPIARIDPATDKVVQQFVGEGGGSIYTGLNSIWIPNLKPNTLSRFDPKRIKATLAE